MGDVVKITGADSVIEGLQYLAKKYPSSTEEALKKAATQIKKDAVANTRERVKTNPKDKYTLTKNYGITSAKYIRASDIEVSITSKSPHWHLVENPHAIVTKSGARKGETKAYELFKDAFDKNEDDIFNYVDDAITEILKKKGMI